MNNSITLIDNHFDNEIDLRTQNSIDSFLKLIESNSNLTNSDLTNSSNLTNSDLTNSSNLTNSDLTNSNLTNSNLDNSDLTKRVINKDSSIKTDFTSILDKMLLVELEKKKFPNARTKYFYVFFKSCQKSLMKGFSNLARFFSNSTSSIVKNYIDPSDKSIIHFKQFKFRESVCLFLSLLKNRQKGNPNIYIFYNSKVKNI